MENFNIGEATQSAIKELEKAERASQVYYLVKVYKLKVPFATNTEKRAFKESAIKAFERIKSYVKRP